MARGRIAAIPTALPGVDDLMSLVKFLSDPAQFQERVAALQALIDESNRAIAEANRAIEAVATVDTIHTVLAQAESQRQEAAALRKAAETEAAAMKEQAKTLVHDARNEVQVLHLRAAQAVDEAKAQRDTWQREYVAREEDVRQREQVAERTIADYEKAAEQTRLLQTELSTRLEKLKAAVAGAA